MYRVYGDMLSGNCYKIKLLMQWLSIEHEWLHVDILAKETHTEAVFVDELKRKNSGFGD